MLKLPGQHSPFEVHTDASDFAIGGVLVQDGHPVAYESRKLNETERRYTIQSRRKKEMTAVVDCLRVLRHYPLGSPFLVKTSNVATSDFQTQKTLSPKQARWQDFLFEFYMILAHKPGRVVADAKQLMALRLVPATSESRVEGTIVSHIREGLEKDPLAKSILRLVEVKTSLSSLIKQE